MEKNFIPVILVVIMIALIVAVDILLFKRYVWARLVSNVGIVLIFFALYLRFFK